MVNLNQGNKNLNDVVLDKLEESHYYNTISETGVNNDVIHNDVLCDVGEVKKLVNDFRENYENRLDSLKKFLAIMLYAYKNYDDLANKEDVF